MSEGSAPARVLATGLDPVALKACAAACKGAELIEMPLDIEKLIESPLDPAPAIVLCGPPPEGVSGNELAQALRMVYAESPIYFITTIRVGFERKSFQKNGFTDAFLIPIDLPVLDGMLRDGVASASKGVKIFKAVKMIDITGGEVLDFDTHIHLPSNGKYIKLSAAGDSIDQERLDRYAKKELNRLHVEKSQMPKFYEFTANQLKKIQSSSTMSATEKSEKIQSAVRDIMGGIFNDSTKEASTTHGKSIVADCQQIVKAYVLSGDGTAGGKGWYAKVLAVADISSNSYSHSANVATYAAMFSLGLGVGKPEEIALAGILHDIGLADVPMEIQIKTDRTKQEDDEYQKHVEHSLKLIRDRKLIVSEVVLKAIGQHHERFNGTGYPKGVPGQRICPEAQILALADTFDYLTSGAMGQKRLTPTQALDHLVRTNASQMVFNPELLSKLQALFKHESAQAA